MTSRVPGSPGQVSPLGRRNDTQTVVSPTTLSQSSTTRTSDFSLNASQSLSFRAALSANAADVTRPVTIRVDPNITTSFDPADKELYDLWVSS